MDRSIDSLTDGINTKGGNSFIIKIFRKGLIRQFSKLDTGYILLQDGTEKEEFGDKNSGLRATLQVHSPEFAVSTEMCSSRVFAQAKVRRLRGGVGLDAAQFLRLSLE